MQALRQEIQVSFRYNVYLTRDLFNSNNSLLADTLRDESRSAPRKVIVVADAGVVAACPQLLNSIREYFAANLSTLDLCEPTVVVPGGESVKNSFREVARLHELIHDRGLCRHSYLIAIGGGAVLDMAGFAAATAHRGIRHVRVPTTVLAQDDSGVGVKNSINAFGKKNFLGTFAPPYAVINDSLFLEVLSDREWRSGIAEAIKVSLIKDADFFSFLEANAQKLVDRDMDVMQQVIARCAELHLHHIAQGGDPFEFGSARPLDYGHWSAHKLEQLSDYQLRHGEAVAIGMALDTTYAHFADHLSEIEWKRILRLIQKVGLPIWAPELSAHLDQPAHPRCVLRGLEEFREHLGGELTIILLNGIGRSIMVNEIDDTLMKKSVGVLQHMTIDCSERSYYSMNSADVVCTGD
jgi:3-dehydroquinate synthase